MFERNQFKSFQWTFKRCQQEEANYMKPKGRYYAAFFLLKNEEILTCVPNFLKMLHYEKTYGPLYHEDYCSEMCIRDRYYRYIIGKKKTKELMKYIEFLKKVADL